MFTLPRFAQLRVGALLHRFSVWFGLLVQVGYTQCVNSYALASGISLSCTQAGAEVNVEDERFEARQICRSTMADALTTQEAEVETHQLRRGTRFGAAVGCLLILVAAIWAGSYWISSHSRYKVVGKTDPTTGYHIEYTVSSQYSKGPQDSSMPQQMPSVVEEWRYSRVPASRFTAWIRKHIPWITNAQPKPGIMFDPGFSQSTWRGPAETHVDPEGFVTIGDGSAPPPSAINERTLSSGCPTTFTADDGTFTGGGGPTYKFRVYNITVRPRNQPITFVFMAFSNLTHEPNDLQNEMIAIRDSIRVVKGR